MGPLGRSGLLAIHFTNDPHDRGPFDAIIGQFPADDQPTPRVATAREALDHPDVLTDCGLAWLHRDDDTLSSELYELVGRLQDRNLPVLLTTSDTHLIPGALFQDGVVSAPIDAPPATLYAMLSSLASQINTVLTLRTEAELLRMQQGGLCDQMDKIDEELRMAAQLQRDMLPLRLPDTQGLDFKVLFRPAGYVSGDIYDIVALDHRHIGVFVADAVGHGVPAALLTVFIKRSLREAQVVAEGGRDGFLWPQEALQRLNTEMIRHQTSKVRFATACYAVIDCKNRLMTVSRAGHPYPLVLRESGKHDWVQPDGGLLGVFPDETFESEKVPLEPGDRVVFYSDGMEAAFPPAFEPTGRVSEPRYRDELLQMREGSLDEAFNRLTWRLDQQAGSLHQADDLTALLMDVA